MNEAYDEVMAASDRDRSALFAEAAAWLAAWLQHCGRSDDDDRCVLLQYAGRVAIHRRRGLSCLISVSFGRRLPADLVGFWRLRERAMGARATMLTPSAFVSDAGKSVGARPAPGHTNRARAGDTNRHCAIDPIRIATSSTDDDSPADPTAPSVA